MLFYKIDVKRLTSIMKEIVRFLVVSLHVMILSFTARKEIVIFIQTL